MPRKKQWSENELADRYEAGIDLSHEAAGAAFRRKMDRQADAEFLEKHGSLPLPVTPEILRMEPKRAAKPRRAPQRTTFSARDVLLKYAGDAKLGYPALSVLCQTLLGKRCAYDTATISKELSRLRREHGVERIPHRVATIDDGMARAHWIIGCGEGVWHPDVPMPPTPLPPPRNDDGDRTGPADTATHAGLR